MSVFRVVETPDGGVGKVQVSKAKGKWEAKDYVKYGMLAVFPLAIGAVAAGDWLSDSTARRVARSNDLGDNMFGGQIVAQPKKKKTEAVQMVARGAPVMTAREREYYAMHSDEAMNKQMGGTLRDALSWVRDNPKKAAGAGISAAGLLALSALMSGLSKNRPKPIPNEADMYDLPIGTHDFFGAGLYSEAQRGGSLLSWARANPAKAVAAGLGSLLAIGATSALGTISDPTLQVPSANSQRHKYSMEDWDNSYY